MQVKRVFPVNNVTWFRTNRGGNLIVPVPCRDLESDGPTQTRFFPVAHTQFNGMHEPDHTSYQWKRLLVQDVTRDRELPLSVRRAADAHMVAERYAKAVNDFLRNPHGGLNPDDWQAVSRWTLALAQQHPGLVDPIEPWLYREPPAGHHAPPPPA